MGMPVFKSEKPDISKMSMLTAPSIPTPPLSKTHFIPGPAVEKTSGASEGPTRGGAQGASPGDAPFNANISDHPNNLDLPGHLPLPVGPAVP
eukprot:5121075-Pyramimonas_sp.AAC.1